MSKHTPGPWYPPHFADDASTCDCRSVVSEFYAGAICTIEVDNGLRISDGGNDAPVLSEAKANAHLIAAAPDLLEVAKRILDRGYVSESIEEERVDHLAIVAAIAKAEGRS